MPDPVEADIVRRVASSIDEALTKARIHQANPYNQEDMDRVRAGLRAAAHAAIAATLSSPPTNLLEVLRNFERYISLNAMDRMELDGTGKIVGWAKSPFLSEMLEDVRKALKLFHSDLE